MRSKDTNTTDGNGLFNSIEEAEEFLINHLHGCFETDDIIDGNRVILPEWRITITPQVSEIKEQLVNTSYYITSPDWDNVLYECSAAMGSDMQQAMGMAQGGFIFGIVNAIGNMVRDENPRVFETEFSGNTHSWKCYLGNIVGMGKTPQNVSADEYWDTLKDGIVKRIGNQRLCYVKVYAANIGNGEFIGECRINDIVIDELSKVVEDMARTWGTEEFGSHKQFFMIKQDKETIVEYPFSTNEIMDMTELAMKMFEDCKTEGEYEEFPDKLEQAVGDKNLAWELYSFIPEICAQNAFDKINYPETILIYRSEPAAEYYKTQLASYYPIFNGVFRTFSRGVLKDADNVYREYISVSSIWSVICSAKSNGHNLEEEGGQLCTLYNAEDDYIVR